uniref:protein-tyrosine-phosphatase n=1 Tax=Cyclopterus lumpus TaxID=8103 RepID=A0A8C3GCJ4_CYCLU
MCLLFSPTEPEVVSNITVTKITTSSISLKWTKPEGNSSFYRVQWTDGNVTVSANVTQTNITITKLTAGVQYEITVTAVADDEPSVVRNLSIIDVTTSSMFLTWTEPDGNATSYTVQWSLRNDTLTVTIALFTDLNPGDYFFITVTAVAGSFTNTSDQSSFATEPTPPGSIIIISQGTYSLHLKWATPALMEEAPDISYIITYQPEGGKVQNNSTWFNTTELSSLLSGTSYNITVETVGPHNLSITLVFATVPEPVYHLTVGDVNTTSIQLTWLRPIDHKPSYSYLVIALQDAMVVQNESTKTENYTFFHLTPETSTLFHVFVVVAGVKSAVESIQSYTSTSSKLRKCVTWWLHGGTTLFSSLAMVQPSLSNNFLNVHYINLKSVFTEPEAVSGLMAIVNTTTMSVSWTSAVGQVVSYTVLLYRGSHLVANNTDLSNTTVNQLFQGLTPGVLYCVELLTKSGHFESRNSSVCNATFPNPPGTIMVESQTVTSINFTWASPKDMDHDQYNFRVSSFNGAVVTGNNWYLLNNLQSGSPNNISVVTVGVWNYESTAVTTENYTRPYPVTMLRQTEISTNAVTLEWEPPENKSHYSYIVETTNGSFLQSEAVANQHKVITGLLSGSNYSFTVTTQTPDGTQSAPVTVFYCTRPYSIARVESETLNTTAVLLVWTKPPEYKPEYTYLVLTTGCCSQIKTFAGEVAEISELTPGTNCTFCVVVRAADGIEGKASCTSQYTKPEAVQPHISSLGYNSSILVSWNQPPGKVEHYKVYLNSTPPTLKELNSNITDFLFGNLSAGRRYTAVVTTCSGPFNASSGFITNATYPNPPGSISVWMKTTSSIDISWNEAPLMAGAIFHYQLTDLSLQGEENNSTTNTTYTNHYFTSLLSGTSYNISIATVGAMGFKSEKVHINKVTTSKGFIYATNITDGPISGRLIREHMYMLDNLDPGKQYNISVTTETFDETEGASPAKNLKCYGPNSRNAKVILTCNMPNGQYSGFEVTVRDGESNTTHTCNHTVSNLRHDTQYFLNVTTQSCGPPSTSVTRSCWTGITNPPIPENYESLVVLSNKEYNKFTLQIKTSLLNSINGPITHIGVLVTDAAPGCAEVTICCLFDSYDEDIKLITRTFLSFQETFLTQMSMWEKLINSGRKRIPQYTWQQSVAVRVEEYAAYYKKQRADSNCGFAEEFEDLKLVGTAQVKMNAQTLENKPKNRYNNVLPYDSSRVKLSIIHGSPYDDYINANYMPGYNSRKEYIAAQGPLPTSNVQTLVMLTRCIEQGRVKCEQYWDHGTKHFENINVTTTSEAKLEDWTIREFHIKNVKTAETRSVHHFHFTAWPDHGVPQSTELLISFRHMVREHMDQYSRHSPTVVHCSAGVGRTGTFIAIDRLIFQIERENVVDLYGIVHDLRMHRPLMVQTEDQYVFLNQCAMDIIRSRTGTNVDLIYQNSAALSIYENLDFFKSEFHDA